MAFKNLGTAWEKKYADERARFAARLNPIKDWVTAQGWQVSYGREACDLILRSSTKLDAIIYFSGRHESTQDLVLRLRLQKRDVLDLDALDRIVVRKRAPGLFPRATAEGDFVFVTIRTDRERWLVDAHTDAQIEQRLLEFVRQAFPALKEAFEHAEATGEK